MDTMSSVKKKQKKQLDELPNFGEFLNENLKTAFVKTIKKNKAGKIK